MDAAALRPTPDLFRNSNSASGILHHRGSCVLEKSGVPGVSDGGCMQVGVHRADRRWRKSTIHEKDLCDIAFLLSHVLH